MSNTTDKTNRTPEDVAREAAHKSKVFVHCTLARAERERAGKALHQRKYSVALAHARELVTHLEALVALETPPTAAQPAAAANGASEETHHAD